ncbi:MBL fold metallo-hydrolase [Candidatus Gracilibacteria bacterium]|nr:MBL fold metallo-hydrolase [Candidatus Gracilibacteria bacterium]NJM90469.1 MBL fold metallo-hydrolase [Hydrococcus sp. RU_2_2]NJP19399.1 MBL fold metallo-hydrolase [Hydrococcus sp. CRU_1_1]
MQSTNNLVLPAHDFKADFENGSIFFVGTATVLLRYAGFTILTDPNFLHKGDHVHLGYGLRSTRLTNPALEIEQLPPLDFLLLSHMHEDHFDRVAEEKLDRNLPIVTTSHATAKLKKKGFNALHALNTWETISLTKGDARLNITAMPGIHGPSILGALLPPVMGSMLEFQTPNRETKFRIYISGDTLVHEQLKEIPQRYPNIDLALLHLGGTKAFGILLTMDAKQGIKAIQIINPRTAIPIHYNDYTVFKSSLEEFMDAIAQAGLEHKVKYLDPGDTYQFHISS